MAANVEVGLEITIWKHLQVIFEHTDKQIVAADVLSGICSSLSFKAMFYHYKFCWSWRGQPWGKATKDQMRKSKLEAALRHHLISKASLLLVEETEVAKQAKEKKDPFRSSYSTSVSNHQVCFTEWSSYCSLWRKRLSNNKISFSFPLSLIKGCILQILILWWKQMSS